MFMNDVNKREEIKTVAIQDLRKWGIKYRAKKSKPALQGSKRGSKVFKIDLHLLPTQLVTLTDGQQLSVPIVIHELCSYILTRIDTEGLFRKEGSKSRQNEIKLSLNAGCKLENEYHVLDVAVILKTLLRELPEPLIPYIFHDMFLRCIILEKQKLEAALLLCLLLPFECLNTLTYLLRFFNTIAKHSEKNKMNIYNLAVVMGPNLFPFQDKTLVTQHRVTRTCELVQLLIENAHVVGIIPGYIIDHVGNAKSTSEENLTSDKKNKRRSGSLTRMFNGLKKIVGNKVEEPPSQSNLVTPDLLLTPSINRSSKKRKFDVGLSSKKKREVVAKIPASKLEIPFTSIRTPISANPNPKTEKRKLAQETETTNKSEPSKDKKSQWYLKNKSSKTPNDEEISNPRRSSLGPKSMLERRWSVVSQAANFRRNKKRNSVASSQVLDKKRSSTQIIDSQEKPLTGLNEKSDENTIGEEPNYVRVPKAEYEEIKNRVSAIERRISVEMDQAQAKMNIENQGDNIKNVQAAYEETLDKSQQLSPTTDQLAKRFSRDLKIRKSSEPKTIRSPSARKIGTIRRRSRELERQNASNLSRNQSWHLGSTQCVTPRGNLKRGKPNTVNTGLPTPPTKDGNIISLNHNSTPNLADRKRTLRSSFLNQDLDKTDSQARCDSSGASTELWVSAEGFFTSIDTPGSGIVSSNGRPSVAKIRSQNAGMVLAKAKLFDHLADSDSSSSMVKSTPTIRKSAKSKITYKIGGNRTSEARLSMRVRSLRDEDRERKKGQKIKSPRRRVLANNISSKEKLMLAKQIVETSKENDHRADEILTPKRNRRLPSPSMSSSMPRIKKALITRSPKRLYHTPNNFDRRLNTPLKVLVTPQCLKY